MAKTLKDFLEGYLKVKSADEQKFIDKHVTAKNPDRNGNGDGVFKGSTKAIDRRKERKGYNPGEDEKVYEAVETERVKHPVGQRPKGPGWVLKQAGEQTGKDHNVWKRKFKKVNEELKGKQKNIDANHNGKIDAQDFKLLKKKKVAEEAEELEELSTPTLQGYRKKARAQGNAIVDKMKMGGGDWSKDQKDTQTLRKRSKGANMSGKQLVKRGESLKTEEAEQIDELSKATVGSYAQKAKDDLSRTEYLAGKKMGERMHGARVDNAERRLNTKASKRYKGIGMAINKLAKEEVEELDEKLTAKTPMGTYIKDFKKSDAPQFKGKSPAKRRVMAIAAKLSAERNGKPLNKEERLQARLGDLSETHKRTLTNIFEKLNEDNKSKFLEACDTPEGIEQMLDFAINHRGE